MMGSVFVNGQSMEIQEGDTYAALAARLLPSHPDADNPVTAALAGNRIHSLCAGVLEGVDVTLLDMDSADGRRVYERSLFFVFLRAVRELMPDARVDIQHSMGEGVYGEIIASKSITPFDLEIIEKRMHKIVEADEPFVRDAISRQEAIHIFEQDGQHEKAKLLAFGSKEQVHVYRLGHIVDSFYGYLVPSTGYLRRFKLQHQFPGFLLLYPQSGRPGPLQSTPHPKLSHVLRQAEDWAEILEVNAVADLNDMVLKGNLGDFIRVNEALHEKAIAQVADMMCASGARLNLIAGPSSSGKTTFAQRLSIQLRVNGRSPFAISLDNYYLNRDDIPIGPDGQRDFEDIATLDLDTFNRNLAELLAGEETVLPRFNFQTGMREKEGISVRIGKDQVILIEGIHGLNDKLTPLIPDGMKFKVYISALTQLNLDAHNRITTTDLRLIRRIVRDYRTRNADACRTISMWPKVREGENKWIFPFQEQCDIMFNSSLVYELLFLKALAYPLLNGVTDADPCFTEANRLSKFLTYFLSPEDTSDIPGTSLLREFLGGGCFGL